MSTWVTRENRPVTKANKKQKANISQMRQQLTWQEIKHTTHQLSSPELQACASKHVAGKLCGLIYTGVFSPWTEVCFPSLLRVVGLCAPATFGGSTQETTCAKLHPVRLLLLPLSPFQQMAFLSSQKKQTTGQVRVRRKLAFTNPRNKFYLDTARTHSQRCKLSVNATLYNYISHQRERNSS